MHWEYNSIHHFYINASEQRLHNIIMYNMKINIHLAKDYT